MSREPASEKDAEDSDKDVGAAGEADSAFISDALIGLIRSDGRMRILANLQDRAMTPAAYAKKFGGTPSGISRQFREMTELGWLKEIGVAPGRGRSRTQYEAAKPFHLDSWTWKRIPVTGRSLVSAEIWEEISGRVEEAMEEGTFEARTDRHLSWMPLTLDPGSWSQVTFALDEFLLFVENVIKPQAAKRLAEPGVEAIHTTLAMTHFRSPVHSKLGGRPARWVDSEASESGNIDFDPTDCPSADDDDAATE